MKDKLLKFKEAWREPMTLVDRAYKSLSGLDARFLQRERRSLWSAIEALGEMAGEATLTPLSSFTKGGESADSRALGELLSKHGSDKSTTHDYHLLYAHLLKGRRTQPLCILEIGLGTNNLRVPSNMGSEGRPGASLRAFRDWGPNFSIYGADVDRGILFSEERIKTYFVDQTDRKSLHELAQRFPPQSFDLIIDDGLHKPWANFNTILALAPLLKPKGTLVVEDILDRYLLAWSAASALLSKHWNCTLVQCRREVACVIKNTGRR